MVSTKRGERLKGKNAIITGAAGWVLTSLFTANSVGFFTLLLMLLLAPYCTHLVYIFPLIGKRFLVVHYQESSLGYTLNAILVFYPALIPPLRFLPHSSS